MVLQPEPDHKNENWQERVQDEADEDQVPRGVHPESDLPVRAKLPKQELESVYDEKEGYSGVHEVRLGQVPADHFQHPLERREVQLIRGEHSGHFGLPSYETEQGHLEGGG